MLEGSLPKKGVSRRGFLTVAVSAIVAGIVAGVGGYYAGSLAAPVKEVIKEVARTVTTTTTVTAPPTTVIRTVTTTVTAPTTPTTITTTATEVVTKTLTTTETVTKTVTMVPPTLAQISEELIAAAKKEGKVVVYTSLPTTVIGAIEKRFEALYGIDLEWWRGGPADVVSKFITEFDAERYLMDVMRIPLPAAQGTVLLRRAELLAKYTVPEAENLSPVYKDPEGYWLAEVFIPFVMGYNTRFLKPGELPKKPTELTDPKWRGKIAWGDIAAFAYAVTWMNTFEKKYGIDVVKGWAANRPLLAGTTFIVPATKVAKGEAWITLPIPASNVLDVRAQGEPIDFVRTPDNAYPGELGVWMISSKAPRPNAAKLLISFMLCVDGGQELMLNIGAYQPVWPGVRVEKLEYLIKDLKIEFLVEPLWGDALEKKTEEYKKIFLG